MAFEELCPDRFDLIHPHFKKLCTVLVDIDEWGQIATINMLLRYSRSQFLDPNAYENQVAEAEKQRQQQDTSSGILSTGAIVGSAPLSKKTGSFYSDDDEDDDDDEDEKAKGKNKNKKSTTSSKAKKNSDDEDDDDDDNKNKGENGSASSSLITAKKHYVMDPDHRLLLRSVQSLLQSRNSAVVMAVAQLFYYLAPTSESVIVGKSLVRLLRSHREIQFIVLSNIATMSAVKPGMFEAFLKNFFVRATDPTFIRLLKLDIMCNIASQSNIGLILREFQTYVKSSDKQFVTSTIQSIGRCASAIPDVTDQCLTGLMALVQNRNEDVVAESVVVLKKLLQLNPTEYKSYIVSLSRILDKVTVPMARASILWLIGEYSEHVQKFAPDVLRKFAQTFGQEETIVKLQVLTLGAKLYLVNPQQTRLLFQYVLNLASYDLNYDIRDRARLFERLLVTGKKSDLNSKAKDVLLSAKPAPTLVPNCEGMYEWKRSVCE